MLNFYIDTPVAYFLGEHAIPAIYDIAQLGSSIINLFGANTSVDAFVTPQDYLTVQDTPAAVQMNYYWVDYFENATPTIHDSWQQEFEAMGYPQASRNVAISNGNECAVDHGFSPGDVLIEIDDLDNPDFFGDIVHMIGTAVGGALNGRLDLALLGVFPGSSKWYYKFDLHATPYSGRVYYGRVSYEKKLLWLIKTKIHVTQRSIDAPSGILPYDSFSGGFFDINDILDDLPQQLPPLILHHQSFGFIPVVSALDIQRDNAPKPYTSDYQKSYGGGSVPHANLSSTFDNFIVDFQPGNFINNEHTSFQQRNGDWLAGELNGGANILISDCSYICATTKIKGTSLMCSTARFSINPVVPFYNWSIIEGSWVATLSGSGSSVTLTRNGTNSGYVTIQLEYGDNGVVCGNTTLTKRVWVGTPLLTDFIEFFNTSTGSNGSLCSYHTGNRYRFGVDGASSTLRFEYKIKPWNSTSYVYQSGIKTSSSNPVEGVMPYLQPGIYHFELRIENSCGWSQWFPYFVQYMDCSNSGMFRAYPNPTSGTLTVANKGSEQLNKNSSFEVSNGVHGAMATSRRNNTFNFYDFSGNGVLSGQLNDITNIDVSQLKKGTYILEIDANGQKETHQIVIE